MMYRCVTILVLGAFLVIVWTAQAPYLHDFGEWVYQSKILSLYWTQPDEVAGFQWTGYPVPNILAILIMAVLGLIFPAISAAKLFLSLLLVGWYFVLKRFVGELDGVDHPNALMLLLFSLIALSNFFWTGFVSYQLGLLLLTYFLTRFKASMSAIEMAVFGVLVFLSHAMVFLVFILLVVLQIPKVTKPWRWLLAIAPSAALTVWFVAGRHLGGYVSPLADAAMAGWKEAFIYKLGYPLMLGPFKNLLQPNLSSLLDQLPAMYWAGFLANVFVVSGMGVVILLAILGGRETVSTASQGPGPDGKTLQMAAWMLFLFYIFAPYNFFGLINPAGRVTIPLLLISLLLLNDAPRMHHLNRALKFLVPVTAIFTLFTVFSYAVLMQRAQPPDYLSPGPTQKGKPPAGSVLDYNAWIYSQARYNYFNYRIFGFSKRFLDIELGRYDRLAFRTALLVGYKEP